MSEMIFKVVKWVLDLIPLGQSHVTSEVYSSQNEQLPKVYYIQTQQHVLDLIPLGQGIGELSIMHNTVSCAFLWMLFLNKCRPIKKRKGDRIIEVIIYLSLECSYWVACYQRPLYTTSNPPKVLKILKALVLTTPPLSRL